jgi:hypothetical protein
MNKLAFGLAIPSLGVAPAGGAGSGNRQPDIDAERSRHGVCDHGNIPT